MDNNIEKLPLKKRVIGGVISGLFFALTMSAFDYYDNNRFSFPKFILIGLFFGFFMSLTFRTKVTKKKNE